MKQGHLGPLLYDISGMSATAETVADGEAMPACAAAELSRMAKLCLYVPR